jgi:hypothetical protein
MEELIAAHHWMMRRYKKIILAHEPKLTDEEFLVKFCDSAMTLNNPDKLSRWVGFIQGTLIEQKVVKTYIERNLSRELYKPIYDKLGYDSTTVNVD